MDGLQPRCANLKGIVANIARDGGNELAATPVGFSDGATGIGGRPQGPAAGGSAPGRQSVPRLRAPAGRTFKPE
jgi:hypothetical protein